MCDGGVVNLSLQALLIGGAGAFGATLRWGMMRCVCAYGVESAWATLIVNGLGSFLAGLCWGWSKAFHPLLATTLLIGFLGAFTTFSTYTLEILRLLQAGAVLNALSHIFLQNMLGLCFAYLGFRLSAL